VTTHIQISCTENVKKEGCVPQKENPKPYQIPTGKINRLREQARIESLRKDRHITNSEAEDLSDKVWLAGNRSICRKLTKLSLSEWIYLLRTFFEFLEEEKAFNADSIKDKPSKYNKNKKSYLSGVGQRIDNIGSFIDRIITIIFIVIIFIIFKSI
jgi:hypothetical protein